MREGERGREREKEKERERERESARTHTHTQTRERAQDGVGAKGGGEELAHERTCLSWVSMRERERAPKKQAARARERGTNLNVPFWLGVWRSDVCRVLACKHFLTQFWIVFI